MMTDRIFLSRMTRGLLGALTATVLMLTASMANATTPEELAKDKEFRKLVELTLEIRERHEQRFAKLNAEQRQRILQGIDGIYENGKPNERRMNRISQRLGVAPEEVAEIRDLSISIAGRYPDLVGKPGRDLLDGALFGRGTGESPTTQGFCLFCSEYELSPIDPDYETDPCIADCKETLVDENETILLEHHLGLALCAAPAVIPGAGTVVSFACFFEEQIRAMIRYAAASDRYERCKQRCREAEETGGVQLCDDHGDCTADQYCYLFDGPLSNPIPEPYCRPDRALGNECRYDYECESGCCKFHLWSSISHDVCRPSSKCN